MSERVQLSDRADRELESLVDELLHRAPNTVRRWHERLRNHIERLGEQPLKNPLADESILRKRSVRQSLFGKKRGTIRILFTVRDDLVTVLDVRRAVRGTITEEEWNG